MWQVGQLVPGADLGKVQARTFHSAALRQLTHFWPSTIGGFAAHVLESKISLVAEAARRLRISAGLAELRDAAGEIEWAKVTQVRAEDYPAASAKAGRRRRWIRAPWPGSSRPTRTCAPSGPWSTSSLCWTDGRHPRGVPGGRALGPDRYACFVVDEDQDVNPLQKLLLDMWLGDRNEDCVVGDPRQTIYSFTGARGLPDRVRDRVPAAR